MIQVHHVIMYLPPIILNVTKWLFNLVVTWILFSVCTEARPSSCLGGSSTLNLLFMYLLKWFIFMAFIKVTCLFFFASNTAILFLFILNTHILKNLFLKLSFLLLLFLVQGWYFISFHFWNRISSSNMYIIWDTVQTLPFSKVSAWMINGCTDCIFLVICDNWYNGYTHISFKINYVK